ncbi:MAG: Sec-independent protein translocase protein TatB [Acidimicrobiales bacterium]
MLFNVGGLEVLVIAVIALIAVGPEQLPVVIRKAGRAMGQVRTMAASLRTEFMAGADELEDLQRVADPKEWFGGRGTADDPIVRPGYAEQAARESEDRTGDTAGSENGVGPENTAGPDGDTSGDARADIDRADEPVGPIAADEFLAELDAEPGDADREGDQA